jgi:gliding motility-associated-like protein
LSDKDEIKELFQKELGNYEAKVDPSLWNGIQSGLSGASAAGGAATGISVASKVVIGVIIATAATVSSVLIFSNEENKSKNNAQVETTETKKDVIDEPVFLKTSKENSDLEIDTSKEIKETLAVEKNKIDNNNIEYKVVDVPELKETSEEVIPKLEEKAAQKAETEPESTIVEKEMPSINEKEQSKAIIADIIIEKQDNQYVKLGVNGENIRRIEWYFGDGRFSSDISPEHFYEEPGTFEVVAIIHGEDDNKLEKSIKVNVVVEGKFTKLPNAFTPNNDGKNDAFFVEFEGINELQLNIFNKRQELIFSTNDPNFRWRGYDSKGERVPEGEYVYVIIAKDKSGNVINKYKTLTVTR